MNNSTDYWFDWFYNTWEEFSPGDLLDEGLLSSQIAERFVEQNQINLSDIAKEFDLENYEALEAFMKLSESELHILKYFLRLVKSENEFKENL